MKVARATASRVRRDVRSTAGLLYGVHLRCIGNPLRCTVVNMVSKNSSRQTRLMAVPDDAATLSREAVIDHALTVADLDGLGAVSIRRIAQDFGVTPMALYWHVKNKDELLAAMGDRILEVIEVPASGRTDGVDELHGLLTVLVDALRRHPGCTELALARILQCDSGQLLSERALNILRDSGFSVRQSA